MWKCKQCDHKNNNSSERCHGQNCKAERNYHAVLNSTQQKAVELNRKRQVLDDCPKCHKETVFDYLREKDRAKIYKCTKCGAVCKQIGKSKPVLDFFAHIGSGVVPT